MNQVVLTALVFLMCMAIAGIGPDNEVAHFWKLLVGGERGHQQVIEHERILCIVLLSTFLLQEWVPIDVERKLATILFGPDLFGVLLVMCFCFFDTSVNLYAYLQSGEFPQRDATRKVEELLISATNLVLVIAHIKTFKLRYTLQVMNDQRHAAESALAAKEDQLSALQSKEATLLGRPGLADPLQRTAQASKEM